MFAEKRRRSSLSPPVALAAAISMVLDDDDDILGEILHRLTLATSLVRAALIFPRWLRVVSDQDFLRRFRDLHPPPLLDFYTQTTDRPKFMPMPDLPDELAAIAHRARSALDAYPPEPKTDMVIISCLNGRLIVRLCDLGLIARLCDPSRRDDVVLSPLHPATEALLLPPAPQSDGVYRHVPLLKLNNFLPNGGIGVVSATWQLRYQQNLFHMSELRDGAWHVVTSPGIEIPSESEPAVRFVTVGGKLYLITSASGIAALRSSAAAVHSATSYVSMIQLPDGVELSYKNFIFTARADESIINLIHVKELQLHVWLYRLDSQTWLLEDVVCLRNVVYADSGLKILVASDGDIVDVQVGVHYWNGPDARFVFVKVDVDVFYVDMKYRTAVKVYVIEPDRWGWLRLFPFMTIWPPVFPVPKDAGSDQ